MEARMRCDLYMMTKTDTPVKKKTFFANLSLEIVQAIQLLLDGCFELGEVVGLNFIVNKIEEKKAAGIFSMPLHYHEGNEEGLSSYAFFRAYNCLEYIHGFSQGLSIPLDCYGIKFDWTLEVTGTPCTQGYEISISKG